MDEINSQDMKYRKEMEGGSRNLLMAILWARKGYNPATREEPLKLPPDYTERVAPKYDERPKLPRAMPSPDRIREMMERGMNANEIASAMKQSRQKVHAVMQKIKLERRRDCFDERYKQDLWG
jgi:hypothetical protein